jgi:hypothetical protein
MSSFFILYAIINWYRTIQGAKADLWRRGMNSLEVFDITEIIMNINIVRMSGNDKRAPAVRNALAPIFSRSCRSNLINLMQGLISIQEYPFVWFIPYPRRILTEAYRECYRRPL